MFAPSAGSDYLEGMDIKLTPDEISALRQITKTLAKALRDDVRDSLIAKGLIRQKLSGPARTAKGTLWLMNHDR